MLARSRTESKCFYMQKNKKPLMERCRRRKINNYLEELKYLVLSALNKEVCTNISKYCYLNYSTVVSGKGLTEQTASRQCEKSTLQSTL